MRQVLYSILLVNWLIASASSIKFQNIPLDRALSEAKTTGKFVFIDFYTDWCRPCKVMEQQVFKDDSIALLFEQEFISIRINAEKEQQTLVTALGIKAYPTLVFYDPKGRLVFRKEGAMKPRDFQDLSESLISINQQLINYQKNDRKVENVFPYLQSLKWIDERKASKLARKYLHEVKEKDYDDPLIWGLISEFVTPLDRVLFTRVANAENLREKSPESLEILHLKSFDILLEKAMKSGNSAFMRRREQYIKKYGSFLSNKDSVALIGRVQYNSLHDVEKYSEVLESYVEKYLPEEAMHYALISYELSQNYFQESILEFASTLARKSISMEPNLFAYLALSGIQEKLSNYKSAYAFLLLAYEYADEDRQTALNQQEKELKHKMESELASGVNMLDELGDDGRFTLGAGSQRLMYRYPIPQSTSHFVIKVGDKLASNAPISKEVTYIKGITSYGGSGITPAVVTSYEFEGVTIEQQLVPVDKNGNPIAHGLAQYYQISYQLKTDKAATTQVGLSLLFDTMMDNNDACMIAANGVHISREYDFRGKNVPDELLFYKSPSDTSDLVGSAMLTKWNATRPDLLIVGRWPYLHRVQWNYQLSRRPYGDSAYMLRWENKTLSKLKPLTFHTYYGLPLWKKPELRIIMRDDKSMLSTEADIFFENDRSNLDLNAKMRIQELISNEAINVVGVILEGYADISGGKNYNFDLSKKRIDAVGQVFNALQIPFVPKPHGVDQSVQDYYSYKYGNAFDRKVRMIIYYRLKTENHESVANNSSY